MGALRHLEARLAFLGWHIAGPLRLIVLAIAAATAAACGGHQTELKAALVTLDAANSGFTAWDDAHQSDIARQAQTLEQGKADLDSYKHRREPVLYAFDVAYRALAVAALDPTRDSLGAMAQTLLDLKAALTGLGGPWPDQKPGGTP